MAADADRPAIELVALLASAGGLEALSIVLRDLPAEFRAGVVVQQHLGGRSSVLPSLLGRRTAHPVQWARDGEVVAPGRVLVCPPRSHLELMPDGCCRLRKMEAPAERRFDVLLASLAGSYGARGLAVVLSGAGRDGAEGTVSMRRAGAVVIAQSPETAEYPAMPLAAAQAGADLVLPIHEIGRVLADIVNGASLPARRADVEVPAGKQDRVTQVPPRHTVNTPAVRAESARARAAELQRRHQDLAAGGGTTAQTAATARRRADESSRRAQLAQQAAEHARSED
jgi:two-component system chemotaxis response regulator CheB